MPFPLDPTARQFSLANALACALAAQFVYKADRDVDATVKNDWGFDGITHYVFPRGSAVYDTLLRDSATIQAAHGTGVLHQLRHKS